MTPEDDGTIRIGVSTCLMGEKVRHDGGHKKDSFVLDRLGPYVTYVPVCPEMAIGLGVPREAIRLIRDGGAVRLVGTRSGGDHTEAMRSFARRAAADLATRDLDGYVFKSKSPSCGLFRVKVHDVNGVPSGNGRGLYAEEIVAALPDLPVEEEGRLNDPPLREAFIERLFAHHRLRRFLAGDWRAGDLVAFHGREKLLLMAHDPKMYKSLGQTVAAAGRRPRADLAADYRRGFMAAMARRATPGRNANALNHMAGHVKRHLDAAGRAELSELIEDYRNGLVPLIVPVTLLRHFARRFEIGYLAGQSYLDPHPKELMLRNHA